MIIAFQLNSILATLDIFSCLFC